MGARTRIKLALHKSADFEKFISLNFEKYSDIYIDLKTYASTFHQEFEHVYYNADRNFTLQFQMILAAISPDDDQETINKKIKIVSRFIDQFIARRVFNFRTMNYSSILYTVFNLTKDIRRKPVEKLITFVKNYLENMEVDLNGIDSFYLNQYTRRFMLHILARMSYYIDQNSGINSRFEDYVDRNQKNPYDIEHILPSNFMQDDRRNEFDSEEEFFDYRDSFGGLLILQKDKNRSLQDMVYEKKVEKYDSENLLARSLHKNCYKNNPLFLRFIREENLDFKPYETFGKNEIDERQQLYKEICKKIWNPSLIDQNL